MSQISEVVATQRLSSDIEKFSWDDIVEIHNELFPLQPHSVECESKDADEVRKKVMNRLAEGLESEEIIDLWNVVFPRDRNVWFDDEQACVRFNEEPQQVESSE